MAEAAAAFSAATGKEFRHINVSADGAKKSQLGVSLTPQMPGRPVLPTGARQEMQVPPMVQTILGRPRLNERVDRRRNTCGVASLTGPGIPLGSSTRC
jgi:hypothetical protein